MEFWHLYALHYFSILEFGKLYEVGDDVHADDDDFDGHGNCVHPWTLFDHPFKICVLKHQKYFLVLNIFQKCSPLEPL